jgi:hypothetical protein
VEIPRASDSSPALSPTSSNAPTALTPNPIRAPPAPRAKAPALALRESKTLDPAALIFPSEPSASSMSLRSFLNGEELELPSTIETTSLMESLNDAMALTSQSSGG